MSKNKIRGAPKKKAHRARDSDVLKKIRRDIDGLIDKGFKYVSDNKKKMIPYALFTWVGDKFAYAYRTSDASDFIGRVTDTINSFNRILDSPLISLNVKDIFAGIIFALIIKLLLYIKMSDAKNYRKGEEYGSASFGDKKDIQAFIDWDNPYNNLLLSSTERLSMNPRMPDPTTNRNKNVLIVGGSGSGKTRSYAKPNILQLFGSYIVTDPKGTISIR